MGFKLVTEPVDATIWHDKENKVYTISPIGVGGPIVSAPKVKEAKAKFEAALKLSSAVANLLFFSGASKSNTEKKRRVFTDMMKQRVGEVTYHQMAA